jgi:SNF2 family DNA or RNA helicase
MPPCRRCGIKLRKHQRVSVAWLYVRGKGLCADKMGLGKTVTAAGVIACAKQAGELDHRRAVVVVRPAVLKQWHKDLNRFLPKLHTVTATGTRRQRVDTYLSGWDILITGAPILVNDQELLDQLPIGMVVLDDIDPLRQPDNRTAHAAKRLARRCERVVVNTATPMHKRLVEMHSVVEPIGGLEVFGPASRFRRMYVREENVRIYNPSAGRMVNTRKTVGYKNLDDFITKLRPMTIRRSPEELDDVDMPALVSRIVWLDLHPEQKKRYDILRAGVLKIIKAEGASVTQATAGAQFSYGAQICAGLATLGEPDRPGTSSKLDWVMQALDGDLEGDKVVVFCQFTNTLDALSQRLTAAGIGHVKIWGREQNKTIRNADAERFWSDSGCRVLLGTAAIEQGLNLQVARHLINVDQILNPARMNQLAGRIRRDGSAYQTVYVHNLFCHATQEEGYLDLLEREQALADHIWDERSDLYEQLNPLALLHLIGQSR